MSKHTPGPWSVERDRAKSLSLYAGTTFIGEVYHDKDEPSTEEQGNVNLIAAAPAMYEALALVVIEYAKDGYEHDNGCNIFYSNGVCDCTRVKVRIALAQARRD